MCLIRLNKRLPIKGMILVFLQQLIFFYRCIHGLQARKLQSPLASIQFKSEQNEQNESISILSRANRTTKDDLSAGMLQAIGNTCLKFKKKKVNWYCFLSLHSPVAPSTNLSILNRDIATHFYTVR